MVRRAQDRGRCLSRHPEYNHAFLRSLTFEIALEPCSSECGPLVCMLDASLLYRLSRSGRTENGTTSFPLVPDHSTHRGLLNMAVSYVTSTIAACTDQKLSMRFVAGSHLNFVGELACPSTSGALNFEPLWQRGNLTSRHEPLPSSTVNMLGIVLHSS